MRKIILAFTAVLLAALGYTTALGTQASKPSVTPPASSQQDVLNKFCISCHSERLHTAEIVLEKADIDHPAANAVLWEKVLHKIHTREMPPARMPRPDDATYEALAKYLETALDQAAQAGPNPGRPAVHR